MTSTVHVLCVQVRETNARGELADPICDLEIGRASSAAMLAAIAGHIRRTGETAILTWRPELATCARCQAPICRDHGIWIDDTGGDCCTDDADHAPALAEDAPAQDTPAEDRDPLAEAVQEVIGVALVRDTDKRAGETFTMCRACGEWEGHKDGCPIPPLIAWLDRP